MASKARASRAACAGVVVVATRGAGLQHGLGAGIGDVKGDGVHHNAGILDVLAKLRGGGVAGVRVPAIVISLIPQTSR